MLPVPQFVLGLLAALSAAICWGIQLPLAKDAFATVDLFYISALRYAVASLCLVLILAWREGWRALSYGGFGLTAVTLGLIGMCGSPTLVFVGMSMSAAEHAVVIVTLQPAIAVLAFWLLRGRRPAVFTLACIALAFIGVVLVVTRGQFDVFTSSRQIIGDLIVFLGAGCWVAYTVGIARLAGWSIWRITVLTMIPGAIASLCLTAVLATIGYVTTPPLSAFVAVGWDLAFLTFVGVLYGMLAWNYGTRRIGAMNATLLINCMPVSTFVYRAVQGKQFAAVEVGGACLVVFALIANNLYLRAEHLRTC